MLDYLAAITLYSLLGSESKSFLKVFGWSGRHLRNLHRAAFCLGRKRSW